MGRRKVIQAALIALVLTSPVGAAPAHVQSNCKVTGSGTTDSVGFQFATTAGSLIVVAVWVPGPALNVVSVIDSQGNHYLPVAPASRGLGPGYNYSNQLWYWPSAAAGPNVVQVTLDGAATEIGIYIHEYDGFGGPAVLDVTSTAQGGTDPLDSGFATTTAAPELVFGFATATNTLDAGVGFTARQLCSGDMTEDRVALIAGPTAVFFSFGGGWAQTTMATFKLNPDAGMDAGFDGGDAGFDGGDAGLDGGTGGVDGGTDAGAPDAGCNGACGGGTGPYAVGCNCGTPGGVASLAILALAVLILRRRQSAFTPSR